MMQHHQQLQDSYLESPMLAAHDQHRQQHLYPPSQQPQQALATQPMTNNTNYYESNYQDCHQDYYTMIQHQHNRSINPFQHHHHHHQHPHHHQPVAAATTTEAPASQASQCWPHAHNHAQSTSPQLAPSPAIMNQQFHLAAAAVASHQQPEAPANQIIGSQCWPNHSQSSSPQLAASPAVMSHQFHLATSSHQSGVPPPVSPYANPTYTNGYNNQHHHHHHHHHQQQHYGAQHAQHGHHHAIMQSQVPEDVYGYQQHQTAASSPAYNQIPTLRSGTIISQAINTVASEQAASPAHHNILQSAYPHTRQQYSRSTGSKLSPPNENMALNARVTSMGANSSPKHHQLPPLSSANQMCRRQSSSVVSTSSAGSNLSDHHSPTESPSSVPPSQPMSSVPNVTQDQANNRLGSLEGRLSAGANEAAEQDTKESQLSRLDQQCAVLLDEQQQQLSLAISSPNSQNNGTNASNTNTTNMTPTNGNNSGRMKRMRTSFKHNQLREMKRWFSRNQNPDAKDLKTLAQTTGLSKRVLQVWFQNARAKHRRTNAKAANQQLYDVNQHTSHMLQFQQQQQQHHHQPQDYHHHQQPPARQPITDQAMNSQQTIQHHLSNQEGCPMARAFLPMNRPHQVPPAGGGSSINNLVEHTTNQPPLPPPPPPPPNTNISHSVKQEVAPCLKQEPCD